MNVLQICAFAAPTPGNFISTLTKLENELKKQEIQTIYAFPERASDKDWCKEIQSRAKVYFLPENKARILPSTYRKIKKIYTENNIDIVHSHFELYDIPSKLMANKNTRVFWHLHDPLKENYSNASATRKTLTRFQYGFFSHSVILVSCSIDHAKFASKLGFNKNNIKYIPNGIDTTRINLSFNDNILNSTRKNRFLMFGWDIIRKGVDLIINVAKEIENNDYSIKIVGNDNCKDFIKKQNAPSAIKFSYPETDVNILYQNADLFIHVSRAEGLSYALLEAIYSGLPVICSDIPENKIAEVFKNIFWVKNNNVDAICNQIISILMYPPLISLDDIEYNRKIIDDKFSVNSWVKNIIVLYTK